MNWGTGIVISFILFIAMIFLFIFLGSKDPTDLVTEDYYAQELRYEEVIQARNQTAPFADSITLSRTASSIELTIPVHRIKNASGEVHFYRPSEADQDKVFELDMNADGRQIFSLETFKRGKYIVKVSWQKDGLDYFWEQDLFI